MIPFSSAGAPGTPFSLSPSDTLPQIATDSSGDVYFPNPALHSVQVFNSAGVPQGEIECGGCPGGGFGEPVSVAIGSDDDLYVVDLAPDRVIKLTVSGGSYGFDSILQSGHGAAAVGVDPSTDEVFVGDFPNGRNYHVVAYDSSGTQFDDFGAGLFVNPPLGIVAAAQIAVDATTHKLYLSETNKIYVFVRATISPPSATSTGASAIGQVTATLNATVNASGHAALACEFEYTDEADVSYANATSMPCPGLPDGSAATALGATVPGLLPETPYRYRVTATNNGGSVTSGSETFETLPVVSPDVTTESPLNLTQASATIRGRVNPQGGSATNCHFDFGTSVAYESSVSCSTLPAPITTEVPETRGISGLAPGTTYHYRLVVSTNAGTAKGDDVEFTTMSTPSNADPGPGSTDPPQAPNQPPNPTVDPPAPGECGTGFRLELTGVGDRCVKVCKKGFRRKRVQGRVRCVKRKPVRRHRHRHRHPHRR